MTSKNFSPGPLRLQHLPSPVRKEILVVDNFCPLADRVRQSALESGFGTWKPNKGEIGSSIYDGMNFWGDHGAMLRALCKTMGRQVYPNSMFFRVTNKDTEAAYVHSDREAGDYTAIVYLSKHDGSSGTGFYRHIESGTNRMPPLAEVARNARLKEQMVSGSPEYWEQTFFIEGRYNRALIFEAPLFHSRLPKHGFGDGAEDGRMVWICHFNI